MITCPDYEDDGDDNDAGDDEMTIMGSPERSGIWRHTDLWQLLILRGRRLSQTQPAIKDIKHFH